MVFHPTTFDTKMTSQNQSILQGLQETPKVIQRSVTKFPLKLKQFALDLLQFLAATTFPITIVTIDFAGLTTNKPDLVQFLR
jgi:hypothetical protein